MIYKKIGEISKNWRLFFLIILAPSIIMGCTNNITDPYTSDDIIKQRTTRNTFFTTRYALIDLDKPFPPLIQRIPNEAKEESKIKCLSHFPKGVAIVTANINSCESMYIWANRSPENRNHVQAYIIRHSKAVCDKHLAAIIAYKSGFDFSTSVITAGLTAAGALVTGGTTQIISAAASGVNATRSAFSADIYQKFLATAVVAEIRYERALFYEAIRERRTKTTGSVTAPIPLSEYSVDEAILDAVKYHHLCSFYVGLVSLARKAGHTTEEQKNAAAVDVLNSLLNDAKARIANLKARVGNNVALKNELKNLQGYHDALEKRLEEAKKKATSTKID